MSSPSLPDRLDPAIHLWLNAPAPAAIFAALAKARGWTRFVGGAVRDALLGRPVGDIDLATTLPPESVMTALMAATIKVVPTGLEHGTVTAVIDGKGYEITTLRRDVATDGRRATVAYTTDWAEDAARRDFTMNAIYADATGALFDFHHGREDLAAGRVRFIGRAEARIREDVLRILRFFRFLAWFGRGAPDAAALDACVALAGMIPTLSRERIGRETIKLLAAPNPAPAWRLMLKAGVVGPVAPRATRVDRLDHLIAREASCGVQAADPLIRLAALLPVDERAAFESANDLKLSNRQAARLATLATLPPLLGGATDRRALRHALYDHGAEAVAAALMLLSADDAAFDLAAAQATVAAWEEPVFPLRGEDMVTLGLRPGPKVGAILKDVERWWRDADYAPDAAACRAEARVRM